MHKKKIILSLLLASTASIADESCTRSAGTRAICETDANGMVVHGSVPVGIVVKKNVRDAMQQLVMPEGCYQDEGIDCMPGITSAELRAIFNANITDWDNVITANGAVTSTGETPSVGNSPSSLWRCGVGTGGLQTSSAAVSYYSNCFLPVGTTFDPTLASIESCMNACCTKMSRSEIGILPISENTDLADDYRYIRLDGVAPTLEQQLAGNYNLVMNVSGSPDYPTYVHPWGVAGGASVADGVATKDVGGIADTCAPPRVNGTIFID